MILGRRLGRIARQRGAQLGNGVCRFSAPQKRYPKKVVGPWLRCVDRKGAPEFLDGARVNALIRVGFSESRVNFGAVWVCLLKALQQRHSLLVFSDLN